MIELSQVLKTLKEIPWGRYVKFAFLTGSLAEKGRGNDVDIVISKIGLEEYGELLYLITSALGIDEDHVDLVPVDENTPCAFVVDSLGKSVPLYVADWDEVFRIFNICQDFLIDAKKLDLFYTAVKAVL
ncbi:MAG: nucleotidyltransferase domain-containing protein [Pyrobaculum sp.]